MSTISKKTLQEYRLKTFRFGTLHSAEDAVRFVDERGFTFFWPIKDLSFPSVWSAAAGDRPVPDWHDDPGHVTWDWKDSLLGKKRWYYARVMRRRNTMISLSIAPFFYALTENYGSPKEDYLEQYSQGRMTLEAKSVYETLLKEGPLDTLALRKLARLSNRESSGRFTKALDDLQVDFKILPVGISDSGAWHYSFIYDLTYRHFPEIVEAARFIQENQARDRLATLFFQSLGAARPNELSKAFGWKPEANQRVIARLVENGTLCKDVSLESSPDPVLALPTLVDSDNP
jgi:hypothetical protein